MLESSSVDDELANMKRELSMSSKRGELPPGRTILSANVAFPFQDSEIEKELHKCRKPETGLTKGRNRKWNNSKSGGGLVQPSSPVAGKERKKKKSKKERKKK